MRTLGVLLLLFAASLAPPIIVSLIYDDGELWHFSVTLASALVLGLGLWLPLRRRHHPIRTRDGFTIVALMWVSVSLLGSLPFLFGLEMAFPDALFESVSGFTTTGATVIVGLDGLPPSLLFYRQELQWLGGIGVIVFAVAVLPMLGIGGMQLYKAETPGPLKEERLTPRIANTARTLCVIYVWLTTACALAYWIAGMTLFDAIAHSFTTIATGGFSTHDASFAYFESAAIETIGVAFMLLGGISFGVHFIAWQGRDVTAYWKTAEVRAFLLLGAILVTFTTLTLYGAGARETLFESARHALFTVVSVITTTGYGIDDFSVWPLALPVLLIFASFVGGCAGSTSGGMKVIRLLVLSKQAMAQLRRLAHPHAVQVVKVGTRVIPEHVIDGVWGFFAVYVLTFAAFMLALMSDGLDQVTAFGAVASSLNNLGPGLGEVATSFVSLSDTSKLLAAFAMLLGRLEIFTLLILLTPTFWRD